MRLPSTVSAQRTPNLLAPIARALSVAGASCAAILIAASASTGTLAAQTPQAFYPLQTNLSDGTGNFGPATLAGIPLPVPTADGICINGVAIGNAGQDFRTDVISTLDLNDFEVEVEFKLNALPSIEAPVIMGGVLWRWLGIMVDGAGTIGLKTNGGPVTWSGITVGTGTRHTAVFKFEAGTGDLYLDGALAVHDTLIGPLVTGNASQLLFTCNDYSINRSLNGCIRNLLISNDTDLSVVPGSVTRQHAFFTTSESTGPGSVVQFRDASITTDPNGYVAWIWDFDGDGISDSNDQNPTWTYNTCGPTTVTLTAIDTLGVAMITRSGPTVGAPTSRFDVSSSIGGAPFTVYFTDTSENAPTSWAWDFDNNGTVDSTLQNPVHTFAAGVHQVALVASNACGAGSTRVSTVVAGVSAPSYTAGSVVNFGRGCPPDFPMSISTQSNPMDNGQLTLDLTGIPASGALGSLFVGAAAVNLPLDLIGATDCSLFVNPFATVPFTTFAPPTASVSLAIPAGTSLIAAPLHTQGVVLAPGENPLGVVVSDRLSFKAASDLTGVTDPSVLPGIVVHFEGTNTLTSVVRPTPFFNVYNNSTTGETILSVTMDFQNGGPAVAGITYFDIDGNTAPTVTGEFNEGNAQSLDPFCAINSYGGTDVTTGLVYAGTNPVGCSTAAGLGATTGWIGSNLVGANPRTVQFSFTSFGVGTRFGFECDTDGGPISAGGGVGQCLVTVVTSQRTLLVSQLVAVDNDTAVQVW